MSDDMTKRNGQDRKRIALGEEHEVRHWTQKFGVTRDKLEEAVRAVGNDADKVEEYLGKGGAKR